MTRAEMLRRFSGSPVARLATVDEASRPHLVPVVFATDGERVYSAVDEKPKRTRRLQRLRNIRAHPKVALLVDHYSDDWTELWWVRIDGQGRVSEDARDRDVALALLRDKYRQYRAQPPAGPIVVVDIERITGWAAAEGPPA